VVGASSPPSPDEVVEFASDPLLSGEPVAESPPSSDATVASSEKPPELLVVEKPPESLSL